MSMRVVAAAVLAAGAGATCVPFGAACEDVAGAAAEATAFLKANAPAFDAPNAATLFGGVVVPNVNLSLTAKMELPWAADVPKDIFYNYVLPYAHVNEARSDWREYLWARVKPLVANSTYTAKTKLEVAKIINANIWDVLGRPGAPIHFKSDSTPVIYDPMSVMLFGYGSCTGVSILFADALRTVGVPVRLAGTPAWDGNVSNGNHNWVEVYLGEGAAGSTGDDGWYFIEADLAGPAEAFDNPCDKWFCHKAKFAGPGVGRTEVFAAKFEQGGATHFPMAWDLRNTDIPGVDRTAYYQRVCSAC